MNRQAEQPSAVQKVQNASLAYYSVHKMNGCRNSQGHPQIGRLSAKTCLPGKICKDCAGNSHLKCRKLQLETGNLTSVDMIFG